MTDFRCVTHEELQPVLDILIGLPTQTPYDAFPSVAAQLGWTLQSEGIGNTNLPVSLQLFFAEDLDTMPDGGRELASVDFRVTDTLADEGAASQRITAEAFPIMEETVSLCLGYAPTRPMWTDPGTTWDLPDGKQVNLYNGGDVFVLQIWAKSWADIERDAVRRGVDPERIWEVDEWDNPTGTPMEIPAPVQT